METATDLANRTADPFFQQGTLGATVVALAVTLVVVVGFMWRAIAAKDKIIFDLQEAWRNDLRTTLLTVTTAIDTVKSFQQSASRPPARRHD